MIDPSTFPFPFEPITGPLTLTKIGIIAAEFGIFYLAAHVVAYFASKIQSRFKNIEMVEDPEFTWHQIVLAGPLEEMGFRGTAVLAASKLSLPLAPVLFIANGLWSGYHFRSFSAFAYTFVLGLFLTKFWYAGIYDLAWMAIVLHSLHNLINYFAPKRQRQRTKP